jgi:hypothetical protein
MILISMSVGCASVPAAKFSEYRPRQDVHGEKMEYQIQTALEPKKEVPKFIFQ